MGFPIVLITTINKEEANLLFVAAWVKFCWATVTITFSLNSGLEKNTQKMS